MRHRRALRRIICVLIIGLSLANLASILYYVAADKPLLGGDLIQDYLLAKAIRHGDNPYLPLRELAMRYEDEKEVAYISDLVFPSPHTPVLATAFVPLSLLPFGIVQLMWIGFSAACMLIAVRLLAVELFPDPVLRRLASVAGIGAALLSQAGTLDLIHGQINGQLLLLQVFAFRELRRNQNFAAGCWLGVCLAIRFFGWPIILLLTLQRRWNAVVGAVTTFTTAWLLSIAAMGLDNVAYYFTTGLSAATAYWTNYFANLSLPASLAHVAVPSQVYSMLEFVVPHHDQQTRVTQLGILGGGTYLAFVLYRAARDNDLSMSYSRLVLASVVLSPITWPHYFLLGVLPCLVFASRIRSRAKVQWWPLFVVGSVIALGCHGFPEAMFDPTNIPPGSILPWFVRVAYALPALVVAIASIAAESRTSQLDDTVDGSA